MKGVFLTGCEPCLPWYARHMGRHSFNSLLWASVSSGELVCPTPASESQPQQVSQLPMVGGSPSRVTLSWLPKFWSCPHFWPPCPMSSCQPEHLLCSAVCVPFTTESLGIGQFQLISGASALTQGWTESRSINVNSMHEKRDPGS